MSQFLQASDEAAALEELHRLGATDGLPVVIPTLERVEEMVALSGRDSEDLLGTMAPEGGAATVEKVAVAAVMAGCLPQHFPVVMAAVETLCQDEFDLAEVAATTFSATPMVIVNGPARQECGPIASGPGLTGPGHRANASIGRALNLALINLGGVRPGVSDMSVHSHPGRFACCFAEAEEASPFEPWHVSRGFNASESVVTLVTTEGAHSVICAGGDSGSDEWLLKSLAAAIAHPGSNNMALGGSGPVVVLLNPDHATILAKVGHSRQSATERLCELAQMPRDRLLDCLGEKNLVTREGDSDMIPAIRNPDKVVMLVGGGHGMYSQVFPSWCAGAHDNPVLHRSFEPRPFCAVPWLAAE